MWAELGMPVNALSSIRVIFSGRVTDSKFVQPKNAYSPMDVTPSGISIKGKEEQLWKAHRSIFVRLLGSVTEQRFLHPTNICSFRVSIPSGNTIENNFAHPMNTPNPILVTLSGMLTRKRLSQSLKSTITNRSNCIRERNRQQKMAILEGATFNTNHLKCFSLVSNF